MEKVFVDTVYWIAAINPKDQWAAAARAAKSQLGRQTLLITTDEVLAEVLTAFSKKGRQPGREQGKRLRETVVVFDRNVFIARRRTEKSPKDSKRLYPKKDHT